MPRARGLAASSRALLRGVVLVAVLGLTASYGWDYETTRRSMRVASDAPHSLSVEPGESAEAIGDSLQRLGLVSHSLLFRAYLLQRGDGGRLRAGDYSFAGTMTLEDIVNTLVRGEVARHDVTFPEGRSLEEMAGIAASRGVPADAFRKAAREPALVQDLDPQAKDLEGYLFPDTYDVTRRPDAAATLVARMTRRFRQVITPLLPLLAERGLGVREAVTLASLVELETARPDERGRIAAVFLNRLKRGMPLQTDPTVIYALRQAGTWDGNIRKRDLAIDSPYNTYRYPGLPPGPIGSPGREALLAVASPAEVNDLYFVSRNDGSHEFSETLAQHERAVDRFQRRRPRVQGS
jgi:peptidoglycan lytic transglycosylase G